MSLVLVDRNVRPHVSVVTLNKPERLNSMSFQKVYREILRHRKFPEGFLEGTGGRMDALRTLLAPAK